MENTHRTLYCSFPDCDAQFNEGEQLVAHLREHSQWEQTFFCWVCSASFPTVGALTKHAKGIRHLSRIASHAEMLDQESPAEEARDNNNEDDGLMSDPELEIGVEASLAFAEEMDEHAVPFDPSTQEDLPQLTRSLMVWRQRHRVSRAAMQDLLILCRRHSSDVIELPRNEHSFSSLEHRCVPTLPMRELDLPEGKVWVCRKLNELILEKFLLTRHQQAYFLRLLPILSLILDVPGLVEKMHFLYQESPVITHPCNTDGWKEMADYATQLRRAEGKDYLLILPAVFVDGFKPNNFRPDQLIGVYFTLVNFPTDIMNSTAYRFPLAFVPAGADINVVIHHAVVKPLRKLEKGTRLSRTRLGDIYVCGSLFALIGIVMQNISFTSPNLQIGDHPGLADVVGIVGPKGKVPSRHSLAQKHQLSLTGTFPLSSIFIDTDA
jgi:hypothetical protein